MAENYDLRAALGDALPAAGPSRAAVRAMDDVGFKSDPKNNDMKELFVGLDLTKEKKDDDLAETHHRLGGGGVSNDGPSAAQALLNYRREKKAAQEAAEVEAARLAKAGVGAKGASAEKAMIPSVGLARAAEIGGSEMEIAAHDERHLKRMNLSKTAARMSSKQKRRRKQGKEQGTEYQERYAGKVVDKSKRKGRMLAMKQMY